MAADRNEVVVTNVEMPFASMVVSMVKWALASIPALLIFVLIGAAFAGMLAGLVRG